MLNDVAKLYYQYARKQGPMEQPDAVGQEGAPGEGPFMRISLKIGALDVIDHALFETYGCPSATASGSWTCEWVVGKTFDEASALEARDIDAGLGGLPSGKWHCAELASRALRKAITNAREISHME